MVGRCVFFFWGGDGVFVKLHVTGSPCFVIFFVCLSTPVGWDFSLKHQQLNSYDLFLMPKPTMGTPSLTFRNIRENSQLISHFFLEPDKMYQTKWHQNDFPPWKLTASSHLKSWRRWSDCHFLGRGNGLWTQGVMWKTSGWIYLRFFQFPGRRPDLASFHSSRQIRRLMLIGGFISIYIYI